MREKKQKITSFEDDGRIVAPMNVEGMPWYAQKPPHFGEQENRHPAELSREEARAWRAGALKAALLLAGVFGLAGAAFIGLCLLLWTVL